MQVFWTEEKQWGIRSRNQLPKGAFLCEYVGEIECECTENAEDEPYVMDLDDKKGGAKDGMTIDAKR